MDMDIRAIALVLLLVACGSTACSKLAGRLAHGSAYCDAVKASQAEVPACR